AEDGIRDGHVTGVQTCALPICLTLDTLYELANPLCVRVVRQLLSKTNFAQPNAWRYVKSVFKRSLLRFDFQTFGEAAHAIEAQEIGRASCRERVESGVGSG